MSKGSILVIDDESEIREGLELLLKTEGYQVSSAGTGQMGLTCLEERPFDLLLLDVSLPDRNGIDMLKEIHRQDPHLPILLITAYGSIEMARAAFKSGAMDYITKPFQFEEVHARVATHLQIHRLQRELQIHNEQLEETVRYRTHEVEESRLEILRRLAIAAEYRDDNTGEHAQRVGRTAALLAQELQLPDSQTKMIRLAAPLHDVGKIGIPDAVLLKKGKLTAAEFEVIKKHVLIGAEILSGSQSPILQMAESIALHHHERWDGTGYSSGLADERIPLAARIVTVSDVFDALTHERPYKRAWPVQDALLEMRAKRGRQFDPAIIAALHKVVSNSRLIDDRSDCQVVEQYGEDPRRTAPVVLAGC